MLHTQQHCTLCAHSVLAADWRRSAVTAVARSTFLVCSCVGPAQEERRYNARIWQVAHPRRLSPDCRIPIRSYTAVDPKPNSRNRIVSTRAQKVPYTIAVGAAAVHVEHQHGVHSYSAYSYTAVHSCRGIHYSDIYCGIGK